MTDDSIGLKNDGGETLFVTTKTGESFDYSEADWELGEFLSSGDDTVLFCVVGPNLRAYFIDPAVVMKGRDEEGGSDV